MKTLSSRDFVDIIARVASDNDFGKWAGIERWADYETADSKREAWLKIA
jgi:hypothetical protein